MAAASHHDRQSKSKLLKKMGLLVFRADVLRRTISLKHLLTANSWLVGFAPSRRSGIESATALTALSSFSWCSLTDLSPVVQTPAWIITFLAEWHHQTSSNIISHNVSTCLNHLEPIKTWPTSSHWIWCLGQFTGTSPDFTIFHGKMHGFQFPVDVPFNQIQQKPQIYRWTLPHTGRQVLLQDLAVVIAGGLLAAIVDGYLYH